MQIRVLHIILLVLLNVGSSSTAASTKSPSKAEAFFCNVGTWIDNFQLRGLDTNYIALPEHRWRVALSNSEVGVNSSYTTWVDEATPITLVSRTSPSVEVGFNAGFRGYGFGYSWDVLNAYTTNWNMSLGGRGLGVEFTRTVSTNIEGKFLVNGSLDATLPNVVKGDIQMANTSLAVWYSLNAAHYSHNAAIKQDYIQKKSAGSLLLSVAYMSSSMTVLDTRKYLENETMVTLFDGVTGTTTRQVALGLGYGINYTPNKGKVLLHASAHMRLVCYSVNHVTYILPDSIVLPGEPQYMLKPNKPVHVTGTFRAAVSWEINRWVHLSAWSQANLLQFKSKAGDLTALNIDNWNWQVHLTVGVRFGMDKKRTQQILGQQTPPPAAPIAATDAKKSKLPQWISDFFFSSYLKSSVQQ